MKNESKWINLLFIAIVSTFFAACSQNNFSSNEVVAQNVIPSKVLDSPLASGNWGAQGANLVVSDKGANLNLDCGGGQISVPIMVSPNGEFDINGSFQNQGGAEPIGGFQVSTVHFHGVVKGNNLELSFSINGAGPEILSLTLGVTGKLLYCL